MIFCRRNVILLKEKINKLQNKLDLFAYNLNLLYKNLILFLHNMFRDLLHKSLNNAERARERRDAMMPNAGRLMTNTLDTLPRYAALFTSSFHFSLLPFGLHT